MARISYSAAVVVISLCIYVNVLHVQSQPMATYRLVPNVADARMDGYLQKKGDALKKAAKELETLVADCEKKTQTTLDDCNVCVRTTCRREPPSPSLGQQLLGALKETTNDLLSKPLAAMAVVTNNAATRAVLKGLKGVGGFFSGNARNIFGGIGGGLFGGFRHVGSWLGNTGSSIGGGISKGATTVVNTGRNVGNKVVDAGKSVGNAVKSLFGRRRRRNADLDPQTRACYNQCAACKIHTLNTLEERIKHVCGATVLQKNSTVKTLTQQILSMSDDAKNGDMVEVEYAFKDIDLRSRTVTKSRVRYKLDGAVFRYDSKLAVPLSGPLAAESTYAGKLLDTFFGKWEAEFNKKYNF